MIIDFGHYALGTGFTESKKPRYAGWLHIEKITEGCHSTSSYPCRVSKTLQCWKGTWQLARDFPGGVDLHKWPLVSTRTEFTFQPPPGPTLDQTEPERISAPLSWFGWINRTFLRSDESTVVLTSRQLTATGTHGDSGPLPSFEFGGSQAQIRSGSVKVRFSKIDQSAKSTTFRTTCLASETHL